jgi:putative glycosyltransferase (TIGR04372 family)
VTVIRAFIRVLLLPFALVMLLCLRIVRPIIRVQLCVVGFHRFGHLALEPELFLCQPPPIGAATRTVTLWSLGKRSIQTNRYLAEKWRKVLRVWPSWIVDAMVRAGKLIPQLAVDQPPLSIHGPNNGLDISGPRLAFSEAEHQEGRRQLESLGIDVRLPFACLIVRDGSHYASLGEVESSGYSILNCSIERFEETALALADEGIQVVRMGAGAEPPLQVSHPRVFDYAKSPLRNDFLDVYIAGTCTFAISTQTGPDAVCLAFRRPVFYVDVVRFSQFFFGTRYACWNPATILLDGQRMNLKKIVGHEVMWLEDPDEFFRRGITIARSSAQEIATMALAFAIQVVDGDLDSWRESVMNRQVREILSVGMGERGRETFGEPTAFVNAAFLNSNTDWFLAD